MKSALQIGQSGHLASCLFPLLILFNVAFAAVSDGNRRGRPNFIVMQPDDLQFFEEWSPPGHISHRRVSIYSMDLPNIDRLRTNGLEMKRAYAASSMCGTSRYSTVTGRYPSRSSQSRSRNAGRDVSMVTIPTTKLNDVLSVEDGLDCSENNVAALLQRNGYTTGMFGKWHLYSTTNNDYNYKAVQQEIRACGFDTAEAVYWQNLNDNWTNGGLFNHNMEHMTDKAIQFMDKAMEEEKPFFMYFNPTAPHSSGNVYEALMEHSCMDAPEGTLDAEPVIPGMTEGMGCARYRQSLLNRAPDTSNAMLGALWVDDAVGALLLHLETRGILDNTFFLFQLDHGQEAKSTLYEPGVRIAQFVHYPDGIPAGSTFDGLVSTIDIAPTLADYAGIANHYGMDGWSWKSRIARTSSSRPQGDERCILAEMGYDRAVVCSCEKHIVINGESNSDTFSRGVRWGLANQSPVSIDLCDNNDAYIVTPNSSPETTPARGGDFSRLRDAMDCSLEMTNPNETPLYGICDALLIGKTMAPILDNHSLFLSESTIPANGTNSTAWSLPGQLINETSVSEEDTIPGSTDSSTSLSIDITRSGSMSPEEKEATALEPIEPVEAEIDANQETSGATHHVWLRGNTCLLALLLALSWCS